MKSLAPYTHVILRGSCCGKDYNSTSVPISRVVITNTEYLCLCHPPSLQLADIPSASQTVDIPFTSQTADILSTS
jgi:hypothetical protein